MNEYSSVRGVTRNHDDNGNLIDDGEFLFVYDAKDRLVRVFKKASGNPVADYLYDCGNRRTKKIVYSQSNPGLIEKETKFLYDGWEVCEEQNSSGQTEITYVYGNGIDEVLEFTRTANHPLAAGQFFCHQDIQKNVVAITDASGALVEKTFYDAYGAALDSNKQPISLSAVGSPYGFQGRRLDAETGLYYFRHRYYDPDTGRFIQRDPVWDANNVGNQYSLGGNSPLNGSDPLGTWWWSKKRWKENRSKRFNDWYEYLPGVAGAYAVRDFLDSNMTGDKAPTKKPSTGYSKSGPCPTASQAMLVVPGLADVGLGYTYIGKKLSRSDIIESIKVWMEIISNLEGGSALSNLSKTLNTIAGDVAKYLKWGSKGRRRSTRFGWIEDLKGSQASREPGKNCTTAAAASALAEHGIDVVVKTRTKGVKDTDLMNAAWSHLGVIPKNPVPIDDLVRNLSKRDEGSFLIFATRNGDEIGHAFNAGYKKDGTLVLYELMSGKPGNFKVWTPDKLKANGFDKFGALDLSKATGEQLKKFFNALEGSK